jgi:hypothetical protein
VFTYQVTLVINGGFESGDLTGWTLAGDTNSSTSFLDGVIASNNAVGDCTHSGIYGMALGDTNIAYLYQSIPTVAGQDYLLSFWLESLSGGTGQQFLVNWNTNVTATNQIFNQSYTTAFGWTNLQFLVQASGPAVTLQFGAKNIPDYFGLDDISVAPVNPPVFQTVSAAGGFMQLGWSTTAGCAYQLQTKTNLASGGWAAVGGPITAYGASLAVSVTNAVSAEAQRFYRVLMTP